MLNILGIISVAISRIVDNFNRTNTTSGLGISTSGQSWSATRGTWKITSNKAETTDAANTYPVASINLGSPNVSLSADIDNGGPGLCFWLTDANSWWASSVAYSLSSYECNCSTCGGGCASYPSCTGCCGSSTVYNCVGGYTSPSDPGTVVSCGAGSVGSVCNKAYLEVNQTWYYSICTSSQQLNQCNNDPCCGPCQSYYPTYSCNCSTCYTYSTNLVVYSSVSGTVTTQSSLELANNSSAYPPVRSISVQTSGNNITAKGYTNAGLDTQLGNTISYTPATTPTKGPSVGVIKTPSTTNAGSTLDNFSAESV